MTRNTLMIVMLDHCTDVMHQANLISPFIAAGQFTHANLLTPRTPLLGTLLSLRQPTLIIRSRVSDYLFLFFVCLQIGMSNDNQKID